jgi:hypothetical protein
MFEEICRKLGVDVIAQSSREPRREEERLSPSKLADSPKWRKTRMLCRFATKALP